MNIAFSTHDKRTEEDEQALQGTLMRVSIHLITILSTNYFVDGRVVQCVPRQDPILPRRPISMNGFTVLGGAARRGVSSQHHLSFVSR